jgi:hypothetical protein
VKKIVIMLMVFVAPSVSCLGQGPGGGGGGPGDPPGPPFPLCFVDSEMHCADAASLVILEGQLPPALSVNLVIDCGQCNAPTPAEPTPSCPNEGKLLLLASADTYLDYARSRVQGPGGDAGEDDVTEGNEVDCGTFKECGSGCIQQTFVNPDGSMITIWACKKDPVDPPHDTVWIKERVADGDPCTMLPVAQ